MPKRNTNATTRPTAPIDEQVDEPILDTPSLNPIMPNSCTSHFVLLIVLTVTAPSVVTANAQHEPTLAKLARCPQGYQNNGIKCVRERKVIEREIIDAECPAGMSYKKRYTFKCHPDNGRGIPVKPTCPEGWDVHGLKCHAPCPSGGRTAGGGYLAKIGQCILPSATLSDKYMTCPDRQRRIDAFCEEDHIECQVSNVPGTFYYKDGGKCERARQIIPREYTLVMSARQKGGGRAQCPDGQILVKGKYCQDPCPEFYSPGKGWCELRKCILRADRMENVIMCPEGSFANPSASA